MDFSVSLDTLIHRDSIIYNSVVGAIYLIEEQEKTMYSRTKKHCYTTEGCFTGDLLKEPPYPKDHPKVTAHYLSNNNSLDRYLKRDWLKITCAVEQLGRFGYSDLRTEKLLESIYVWHIFKLLTELQVPESNDGYAPDCKDGDRALYKPRFVLTTLINKQIECGWEDMLIDYFGFKRLAPYFSNSPKYGDTSRIGLYGLNCVRYIEEDFKKWQKNQ